MADVRDATTAELEEELARRALAATVKPPKEKAIGDVDWSGVYKTATDGVAYAIAEQFQNDNTRTYIYESAMTAIYGDAYFDWTRKRGW